MKGKPNTIVLGKVKRNMFRIYIQKRSEDDKTGKTNLCITVYDYKRKLTAFAIKQKIRKALKE